MCKHVALFYILIRQTTAISLALTGTLFFTAINLLKGDNEVPMIIPYMECVQAFSHTTDKLVSIYIACFAFKYWICMNKFQDIFTVGMS